MKHILMHISKALQGQVDIKPIVVSSPFKQTWSLREIGSPCNGPIGLPFSLRYLSHSVARVSALFTKTSVKQLTLIKVSADAHRSRYDEGRVYSRLDERQWHACRMRGSHRQRTIRRWQAFQGEQKRLLSQLSSIPLAITIRKFAGRQ